jgi:hypothetical protein
MTSTVSDSVPCDFEELMEVHRLLIEEFDGWLARDDHVPEPEFQDLRRRWRSHVRRLEMLLLKDRETIQETMTEHESNGETEHEYE